MSFKTVTNFFCMELRLECSGAFSLVTFPETQRYNNPRLVQPSCSGFLKFFRGSDLSPKMSLFPQYTTICMICTESWKMKTYIGRNNTKTFVKIFLLLETAISVTPLKTKHAPFFETFPK